MRIDTTSDGLVVTLHLSGRVRSGDVDDLKKEMGARRGEIALDLGEVTLVDVDVVRFLKAAQRDGVELRHCSPYIREWIARE